MTVLTRKTIAVAPGHELQSRPWFFRLLSELYPVSFEPWQPRLSGHAAFLWQSAPEEKEMTRRNWECLVVADSNARVTPPAARVVQFSQSATLDRSFLGQTMGEECIPAFSPLQLRDGDELICAVDKEPYWLRRQVEAAKVWLTALGPPEVGEGQTVYQHFNRRCWLQMLPFFHFLKRLTREDDWQAPPIRACLMFDDPNLHRPTYGFLDLRTLAAHARRLGYHVSLAMVPLDAWWVNPAAAELLKQNQDWISLCMHGNDHARAELGKPRPAEAYARLLAQGLRRIDAFEKRSGVKVSRVMVPPNGAFLEQAADPMLDLGYEAACLSRSSLTHWNKNRFWAPPFGHSITEFIGHGLPVIPRQVLAPGHEGTYRLAAFLNQPIIPHGHHQDCADGLGLVTKAVESINSLGGVEWMDMTALSRSNYLARRSGSALTVRMLSRRCTVPVDEDVKELLVERPWINGASERLVCRHANRVCATIEAGADGPPIASPGKGALELIAPAPGIRNYQQVPPPPFRVWPRARRLICEARDRMVALRK